MDQTKLYIKQNLQLEPLFNQWYAWPQLIAPATAAMHVANSHVRIMKSYVTAPAVHAAAVKNPAMRGGPFLDFDSKRVHEIKALLERTLKQQAKLIAFADVVKSFNQVLVAEAKGQSVENLYAKVPDLLKGGVELVYDVNNNCALRFSERLLYRSDFYNEAAQSISLSLVDRDDRAFVFSTPRMEDELHLHLHLPFSHAGIDALFAMREKPQTLEFVKEALETDNERDALLATFFTDQAPSPSRNGSAGGVRVRYFGHACILIEYRGLSLLTDPIIGYDYPALVPRYTFTDLPEHIDFVLLTHAHSDHVVFESLLQLRHKIGTVIVPRCRGGVLEDPSLKAILEHTGFRNVTEIDELESIKLSHGMITGIPFWGEHGDLNISSKTGYLLELGGTKIMCLADSNNLEPHLYEHVQREVGDVDIVFLGMECDGAPVTWMYGPLMMKPLDRAMDHSRRLCGSDFERGLDIVKRFKSKKVFVYAMGQEPWLSFITSIQYTGESKPIVESNRLVDACRSEGIEAERLFGSREIQGL
jgi:L-ascorbate metabolism protein UlaG (beta-lactamase superfamily)